MIGSWGRVSIFFSKSDSEEKNVSNGGIFLNTGDQGDDKIDRT